jgi:hypothetical protein
MTLSRVMIEIDQALPVPQRVKAFLDDAANRTDAFIEKHRDNPAAGFVPSDYEQVYRALHALGHGRGANLLAGQAFCEWGSGMGVIADLAAMLNFDSVGIEIDARLVEQSQQLASDHGLRVQFICGSYVPDGHECEEDFDESHVMTLEQGRGAYEELGLDPDDFDCIFAYPWPGEDDVVTALFDQYAARGAVLLTFHGQDGMLARRKVR